MPSRSPRRLLVAALACALVAPLPALAGSTTAPEPSQAKVSPSFFADFYPAAPYEQVLQQPDGSRFPAVLTPGDVGGAFEHQGYTVVRGEDRVWRFASGRDATGQLVATDAVVGRDAAPAGVARQAGRTRGAFLDADGTTDVRTAMFRQLQVASRKAQAAAAEDGGPRVFRFPVLMLATWFDQAKGQSTPQFQEGDTVEKYKKLLDGFGGNPNGSLTEFYFEDSFGTFLVQVDVFGPFTSAQTAARQDPCYYGGIAPGDDHRTDTDVLDEQLGVGGGGALGMASEAVPQADAAVDFAPYDNDGNGVVDFVGIIHSGPDMAVTGDPCHTWSHALQATLGLAPGTPAGIPTSDGVTVDRVFTMPEFNDFGKPLTIGVAAHEMAHALGEPDYYNTGYTSMGSGDWDIMSGGSYLGNPAGSNPSGFNPASRVFQGWTTPTVVSDDARGVTLQPRRVKPAGYSADKANPRLVLVPVQTVAVGETDREGHTWTQDDVLGLAKDAKGRYVIEGYYLENMNRTVNSAPIHPKMSRGPYFDRQLLGSGIMTWHFDYHQRSNIINGSNNAQDDANRPQMDVMEWDYNDNTQEQQLSLSRGNAEDLMFGAATGITSGTRKLTPGIPSISGTPQKPVELSGAALVTESDTPFTVDKNPANYTMTVSVTGTGDCTLALVDPSGKATQPVDSGSVGGAETVTVSQPAPGEWQARVGDFAACGQYSGTVTFSKPGDVLDTRGAADTWGNYTQKPSGWAFTNVGPGRSEGLDHSADAGGSEAITLDLLKLGTDRADVSPGFVTGAPNALGGTTPVSAGSTSRLSVPVFNNGGKAVSGVVVEVHRGSATGPLVARQTVSLPGYSRRDVAFSWAPPAEGAAELVTVVDPARRLAEASEANNAQKSQVRVGSKGTPSVLVVDDDGAQDGEVAMTGALASLGVPYAVAEDHPDAATLKRFQAVLWETGGERYQGQLDAGDRTALRSYLDGGGKLLFTGPRIIDALGEDPGRTNPGGSAEGQAFLKQYLGAEYLTAAAPNNEDTTAVGTGGALGTRTLTITQLPGRHVVNELKLADHTVEGSVPAIGKAAPVLAVKGAAKGRYLGVGLVGDAKHHGFQTLTVGFNLAQLTTADQYAGVVGAALKQFGVRTGTAPAPANAVIHSPAVRNQVSGRPVPVRAFVVGAGNGGAPVLYYRRHGKGSYYAVAMTKGSARGAWHAVIPGNAVTPDGVDYYLRAGRTYAPRFAMSGGLARAIGVGLPEVAKPIAVRP